MSLKDTQKFLEDLLLRYDPGIDLTDGSRAQLELVDPILRRLGIDPIDEDIHTFIRERVRQTHPELVTSEVDELTDLIIDPMRVIIEPLVREVKLIRLRSSLNNVESLADDEVDALLSNFFEPRHGGGYSQGQVRIYFAAPQTVAVSFLQYVSTKAGLRFLPSRPQSISSDQMLLNVEGTEYYFDVNYTAEKRGDEYNVEAGEIVSIANLPGASRVRNLRKMRDGVQRETSPEFVARVQSSQGDRTLNTSPGIVSVLSDAFPALRRIFTIGFRDPEMKRDIVTGGGYSTFLADDSFGPLYSAAGTAEDDNDGDTTSPILYDPAGNFVSRLGAAGTVSGWYATLVYDTGAVTTFVEVAVTEVVDNDRIKVDHEFPVYPVVASPVRWILRKRQLEISNIPGGIVLPNGPSGELIIEPDTVHIGGKIDIYVAGDTDEGSATIESLGDESPYATGISATTTNTSSTVLLTDIDPDLIAGIEPGMSLVLDEGSDVGSYRILRLLNSTLPLQVQIDSAMTASQVGLLWRIVDTIDVTLTDPISPKMQGADLVTSAGNPLVVTSSGSNFTDAGVLRGDTLEILGGPIAGRYEVTNVTAVQLELSPAPALSQAAVAFRVYRRSEETRTPVVRVKSMSLLDSAGAPTGVSIPYRHPVLVESRAFQNESSGFLFDGLALLGLVSDPLTATYTGSVTFEFRNLGELWTPGVSVTVTVAVVSNAASIASQIDSAIAAYGRAYVDANSRIYVVPMQHATVTSVTGGLSALGWAQGHTNTTLRSQVTKEDFGLRGLRVGDVVEVVTGPQANLRSRVAAMIDGPSSRQYAVLAAGPTAAYDATVLNPAADTKVRIGRPSVGSARCYFLGPTTAEFPYAEAEFTTPDGLIFRPDPTNTRIVYPAQPSSELPKTGGGAGTSTFTATGVDFVASDIRVGDVLEVLYIPIVGTAALGTSTLAVAGTTLVLRLGSGPWIQISFPTNATRQAVADYINTRVGSQIADIYEAVPASFRLRLQSDSRIEIDDAASTAFVTILGAGTATDSDSASQGTYVITTVGPGGNDDQLVCYGATFVAETAIRYQIRRYTQRASTTEMALLQDSSGLYYTDVELISSAPGDQHNIAAGVVFEATGYYSEGYEPYPGNEVLSYSTAEVLKARLSRSILLDGSPDAPAERVQLSQQNVLVTYDRSQLVEDMQNFCDSNYNRVVNAEALVRHLLPHYVRIAWKYVGGSTELEMKRAIEAYLEALEAGDQLEIGDLQNELRKRGAVSVYTEDSASTTGRSAPLAVIVYHEESRRIRAQIVRDFVDTTRVQRYIAESVAVTRISTGGIR